ncbi:MAG TPA: CinA family protein [Anaerolineales bacterium]|nr:CinA family protein [Anaerolineales bacterium]
MSQSNEPTVLAQEIGRRLLARGWFLATAESCTGGLVSHYLTNVPGSSAWFVGGVVSYTNALKMQLLGVSPETLVQYGAVSEQTVMEMAVGVCQKLGAQVGIAVTGIAGPGGGSTEKPVGLVWVGLALPHQVVAQAFHWYGNRIANKESSAQTALAWLLELLTRTSE